MRVVGGRHLGPRRSWWGRWWWPRRRRRVARRRRSPRQQRWRFAGRRVAQHGVAHAVDVALAAFELDCRAAAQHESGQSHGQ